MISFFPTPYKNETFHSLLSRFHVRIGSLKDSTTIDFLYNNRVNPGNVEFPIQLQQIQANLRFEHPYTLKDWLLNHSSLLYYTPFLTPKKFEEISNSIENETLITGKLPHYIGLASSSIGNLKYLRFCDRCLKESIEKHGEGYWNIMHQLPSVRMCHIHYNNLVVSDIPVKTKIRKQIFIPLTENVNVLACEWIPDDEKDFYIYLANETVYLFNQSFQAISHKKVHDWYEQKFMERSWMNLNATFNRQKFVKELYNTLPKTFIKQNKLDPNEVDWIANLLSKNYRVFVHPVRILGLNYMLGASLKDTFHDDIAKFAPFGHGPWICQNPVCLFYNQPHIKDIEIKTNKKDGLPLGIFECPYCEFTYMRKGPEKSDGEKFNRSRVLDYGSLFKKELLFLVPKYDFNFSAISRVFKVDSKTLKAWYERWQIDLEDRIDFKNKRNEMRNFWEEKINEYPQQTRSFFQCEYSKEYQWIFYNDQEWVEGHFPKPVEISFQSRKTRDRSTYNKKDWSKLDPEFVKKINETIKKLYAISPPVRITKRAIEKEINYIGFFQRYTNKLPLSNQLINSRLEDYENFNLRRIDWFVKDSLDKGEGISKTKIMEKICISNITPRIEEKLREIFTLKY